MKLNNLSQMNSYTIELVHGNPTYEYMVFSSTLDVIHDDD